MRDLAGARVARVDGARDRVVDRGWRVLALVCGVARVGGASVVIIAVGYDDASAWHIRWCVHAGIDARVRAGIDGGVVSQELTVVTASEEE
jgi:hypothetical protein